MKQVFFSTQNFEEKNVGAILKQCRKYGIDALQLGPPIALTVKERETLLRHKKQFSFLLHNLVFRSRDSFIFNLGSLDKKILELSIRHCKKAIDFSKSLGASFFSVHSAFCFNAEPGYLSNKRKRSNSFIYYRKEKVYDKFLEVVKSLNVYALSVGIKFVLENNTLSRSDLVDGNNRIVLLADDKEIVRFIRDIDSDNIGLLIDLGHLNVASNTLGFDKYKFMEKVNPYVVALHLSDNNGCFDEHLVFDYKSWFFPILNEYRDRCMIIEGRHLATEELLKCRDVIMKATDKVY